MFAAGQAGLSEPRRHLPFTTIQRGEPISIGTVTETGKAFGEGQGNEAEVIEKVGAGDGI